jgi:hypothetical protein
MPYTDYVKDKLINTETEMRKTQGLIKVRRIVIWRNATQNGWMFHHDNAFWHTPLSTRQFLTSKIVPVLPQPGHRPYLPSCDFRSPILKETMKGKWSGTTEAIISNTTDRQRETKERLPEMFLTRDGSCLFYLVGHHFMTCETTFPNSSTF